MRLKIRASEIHVHNFVAGTCTNGDKRRGRNAVGDHSHRAVAEDELRPHLMIAPEVVQIAIVIDVAGSESIGVGAGSAGVSATLQINDAVVGRYARIIVECLLTPPTPEKRLKAAIRGRRAL